MRRVNNEYFRQLWFTSGPDPGLWKKRGEERVRSFLLSLQKAGTKSLKSTFSHHHASFQPLTRTPGYAQTLCNYPLTALRVAPAHSLHRSRLLFLTYRRKKNFSLHYRKTWSNLKDAAIILDSLDFSPLPITALLLALWGCVLNLDCHCLLCTSWLSRLHLMCALSLVFIRDALCKASKVVYVYLY